MQNSTAILSEVLKPYIPLGYYRHFKGTVYRVFGVVKHSETEGWYVLYGKRQWEYVRPLKMFSETVEVDGKFVPRYAYIGQELR